MYRNISNFYVKFVIKKLKTNLFFKKKINFVKGSGQPVLLGRVIFFLSFNNIFMENITMC